MIVRRAPLTVLLLLVGLAGPAFPSDAPVAVFEELDGTWEGQFVGWDTSGQELYRIDVRQTYRTVDRRTQTVVVEDRMPDGTVIRGNGRNVARRNADGELVLTCLVEKSNGDRVEHRGRTIDLPGGGHGLVWSSHAEGRVETFVESVSREGDRWVYRIQGHGTYDGTTVIMSGRYVRVEAQRGK